jgi:hypothetical protein
VICDNHQQLHQCAAHDPEEARWRDNDGDLTTSSQYLEHVFEVQQSAQKLDMIHQQGQGRYLWFKETLVQEKLDQKQGGYQKTYKEASRKQTRRCQAKRTHIPRNE